MWNSTSRFVRERFLIFSSRYYNISTQSLIEPAKSKTKDTLLVLTPFSATINTSFISGKRSSLTTVESATAIKWISQCRPDLPRALVQKLFRLRKIRRISPNESESQNRSKRISYKDPLNAGDIILLPSSVRQSATPKPDSECKYTEEELKFIHNLVFYKDSAILAVNKPPGLPVQGGSGVRISLDKIAATCLNYGFQDPPRLVHRLDRDSSGILIMGRTHKSAALLHSIFRGETSSAVDNDDNSKTRAIHKTYLALVLGTPKRSSGSINAPLGKVIVDNGKSERITVTTTENVEHHQAITKYQVIHSYEGFSWLELRPLTGRKHQLRVHCAEILGTPIVGDYKYGRKSHKSYKFGENSKGEKGKCGTLLPLGIDLEKGSISDEQPRLHLHCKKMVLPDFSHIHENCDFSTLKSVCLEAPIPFYMQKSWTLTYGS